MQNAYKDVMRAAEDAVRAAVKLYNTYDGIDKVKSNVSSITPSGGGSRSTSASGGSSGGNSDTPKDRDDTPKKEVGGHYYIYDSDNYNKILSGPYSLRLKAENDFLCQRCEMHNMIF